MEFNKIVNFSIDNRFNNYPCELIMQKFIYALHTCRCTHVVKHLCSHCTCYTNIYIYIHNFFQYDQ